MKRVLIIVFFVCVSFSVFSQIEEAGDTIGAFRPKVSMPEWLLPPHQESKGSTYMSSSNKLGSSSFKENQPARVELNLPPISFYQGPPLVRRETSLSFANDYDYSGGMILPDGSWISGGGSHQTMLTYGSIRSATAIYNRRLTDQLTMSIGPTINKYELGGRQYTTADIGGDLNYRLNNRMNLNLSGQYSIHRNDGQMGSFLGGFYPENPGAMSHSFRPVGRANLQFDYQITDWMSVSPGVYSSRYQGYGYHYNDYGVNTRASFQVHERVKFNVHGKRSMRGKAKSFGPNGMYPQDSYGGSMEYRFSDSFGVETGVIREINPWSGKWETKPYIIPIFYVK